MKILVTGASGYIGNRLAHQLAADHHEVVALVRQESAREHLQDPNIKLSKGDITDGASVRRAIKGCEAVYHVAAYARLWAADPAIFYTVNVDGTKEVLRAASEAGVGRLVFTSSTSVFGPSIAQPIKENDPRTVSFENDYELSKHLAEEEVQKFVAEGLDAVIVNPSRVFGPGLASPSNAITAMLQKAVQGKWILLPKSPQTIGNYAFIEDVVQGHIKAMRLGRSGERYILGGENKSYADLLVTVAAKIGRLNVVQVPIGLLKVLLAASLAVKKITGGQAAYGPSSLNRYARDMAFDCSKAVKELQYRITPFEEAIEQTIESLKKTTICQPLPTP